MGDNQLPDEIKKAAKVIDRALENKDIEVILSCFSDDCEIELCDIKLEGKEGVKRWADWLYLYLVEVKFVPVTIMVDGNTFFEEFILEAKLKDGTEVRVKQAEVLVYENYKIKSLRLYFDRLDFANLVAKGAIDKAIVRRFIKKSLEGLI